MSRAKELLLEAKTILIPVKGKEYRYIPIEVDVKHPIRIGIGKIIEPNSIVTVTKAEFQVNPMIVWVKDKYGNEMAVSRASLEEI